MLFRSQAGVALIGDRGDAPGNLIRRIAYLERPLTASLVGVGDRPRLPAATLRIFPNPALERVRFVYQTAAATEPTATVARLAARAIQVFSVSGRRVARIPMAAGGSATWDGRDRSGRPLASGVYLARIEGEQGSSPVKFMLLH